jgi:phosphatidylinositol-3-phosphatase
MSTSDPTATEPRSVFRCAGCDTRLAADQRYCVECGARRGPLPAEIAALIGAIHEQGPPPSLPPGTPLGDSLADDDERPQASAFALPGPRATAIAVMGMLAFGVVIGSLAGGESVESLASTPLIVLDLGHSSSAPVTQPAALAQSPASGSGGGGAPAAGASSPAAALPQDAQASASPTTSPTPTTSTTPTGSGGLPPVKHVFLIVLSDRGFTQSFGSSSGYLSGALRKQGELVQNYYAVATSPLANEIAMISGQGPTAQTASDCPVFSHIKPGTKAPRGQVLGNGCAYPTSTKTLASQLTAAHDQWKAYVQGVPSTQKSACKVPKVGSTVPQTADSKNVAWRNPFVYFRALTGGGACHTGEVSFSQLSKDLKSASTTPSLSYIIPATCNSGSEAPCRPNAPAGLAGANSFLKSVVPEIKRSPAYKNEGGLIVITFDQAPQTGQYADPSACCSNPTSYPNLRTLPAGQPAVPPAAMGAGSTGTTTTGTTTPTDTTTAPGTTTGTTTPTDTTTSTGTTTPTDTTTAPATTTTTTTTPPVSLGVGETTPTGGGGQVGLLLISSFVKKNSTDVVDYFNHFSLLATLENLFGLHRLGYAGVPGLPVFGTGVFNHYAG